MHERCLVSHILIFLTTLLRSRDTKDDALQGWWLPVHAVESGSRGSSISSIDPASRCTNPFLKQSPRSEAFTLHGLWPNYEGGGFPEYCNCSNIFSAAKLGKNVTDSMACNWISYKGEFGTKFNIRRRVETKSSLWGLVSKPHVM